MVVLGHKSPNGWKTGVFDAKNNLKTGFPSIVDSKDDLSSINFISYLVQMPNSLPDWPKQPPYNTKINGKSINNPGEVLMTR